MRVLITGASRGIGAAIARVFAERVPGVHLALLARSKLAPSHPGLEGTLLDTCRAVEQAGAGVALPLGVDLQDEEAVRGAARRALDVLGGLDVLVHNASVLWPEPRAAGRKMDLLHAVNVRAPLLLHEECGAALAADGGGAIVALAPPVRLGRLDWIAAHPAYTLSKYAMGLATLGMASAAVRANCVWPKRMVATAATKLLEARVEGAYTRGRDPRFVAEAVFAIATDPTRNAQMLLDEDVLGRQRDATAPLDAFVCDDD